MSERRITRTDRFLEGIDNALRAFAAVPAVPTRANPASGIDDLPMSDAERDHAAGLMRVNHAGEVAAQGLYHGHAAIARSSQVARHMQHAAREEHDHLAWCEQRLRELDSKPSRLRPVWYSGAWLIGMLSGILGDRWSLGFVEETERQVSEHLHGHLASLPDRDLRSRAIVSRMREEEELHAAQAKNAGAHSLPAPIRQLMRLTAKVMTCSSYRW